VSADLREDIFLHAVGSAGLRREEGLVMGMGVALCQLPFVTGWVESNKEDGLGIGYLEAVPAAGIRAKKHVIDPHEVVPGIGKFCAVVITCPTWQISLL